MTSAELLTEIIDHFADTDETPGDGWAHPDDFSEYGLDCKLRDGTVLWIDLRKDGKIGVLWRRPGEESTSITFTAEDGE